MAAIIVGPDGKQRIVQTDVHGTPIDGSTPQMVEVWDPNKNQSTPATVLWGF